MKVFLLPFVFLCFAASAQYNQKIVSTTYNKFTEKKEVQWAAYAKDSAGLFMPSLPEILLKALSEKKIKAFLPIEYGIAEENDIAYLQSTASDSLFLEPVMINDTNGEGAGGTAIHYLTGEIAPQLQKNPVELYQIMYIQNGRLFSFINRVSVTREIITPSGLDLGRGEFLSFAANKKYDAQNIKHSIFLGKIERSFYTDSFLKHDRLKELYGQNLVETLWPSVLSGKTFLRSTKDSTIITPQQLISGDYTGAERVSVPVYDSLGDPSGTRIMHTEITASSFEKISITEELYYDPRNNIIVCRIPQIYLYAKMFDGTLSAQPLFRIDF